MVIVLTCIALFWLQEGRTWLRGGLLIRIVLMTLPLPVLVLTHDVEEDLLPS